MKWTDARRELIRLILSKRLGEQLPSIEDLSQELGCSIAPVTRALRALEAEKYLELSRGKRAVIRAHVPDYTPGLASSVEDRGGRLFVHKGSVRLISAGGKDNDAEIAARELGLGPEESLVLVERVRSRDPLDPADRRWDRAYMQAKMMPPNILEMNFAQEKEGPSLLDIQTAAGLIGSYREFTVCAGLATDQERNSFGWGPEAAAVLRIRQISFAERASGPVAYEYLISTCGERWDLTYRRSG